MGAERRMDGTPMVGNIDAARYPHVVNGEHVIEKALEISCASGMPNETGVEPNAHHLRALSAFAPQKFKSLKIR